MWCICIGSTSTVVSNQRLPSSLMRRLRLRFRHAPPSFYDHGESISSSTTLRKIRRRSITTNFKHNTANANTISTAKKHWHVNPSTGHITRNNINHSKTTTTPVPVVPLYQVIIGLEIHVQLNYCPTKLFSAGQQPHSLQQQQQQHSLHTSPWPPNTVPAIHPYDIGVPGIMPVLSVSAVRYAILMAGLLHCSSIHTTSRFERKHYTYSDLPHSYQITQQRWPIATNGLIQCEYTTGSSSHSSSSHGNGKNKNSSSSGRTNTEPVMIQCRINRLQLEQDTAKTTSVTKRTRAITATAGYDGHDSVRTYSRIDMNRAGIPLCEIVTEPDLRSAQEASTIVQHLRQLIQFTHISSAHMQHGQLRVDCNVNIVPVHHDNEDDNNNNNERPRHKHPRVEVKNLNSIQQIEESIQYEAYRQVQVLEERYEQQCSSSSSNNNDSLLPPLREETRTYNALSKRTELLRYKDQQQDYRFLPELDLPPCIINRTVLQDCVTIAEFIDKYTPTLPQVVQEQLVQHLGLSPTMASVIVTHDPTAVQFFRRAVLYALNHPVPDSSTFNVKNDTTDRTATQQHRTLEDIAKCCDTPRAQLHKVANEVANLQCNVLFHVMKEQYRSNLRQSNSVRDDDDNNNDDESVVDDGLGTMTMNQCPISARQLGDIVQMIRNEEISYTMAKQLIELLSRSEYTTTTTTAEDAYISPREVAHQRNMTLMTDLVLLRNFCTTVMLNHPDEVQVYQQGGKYKAKMEKFFIGKVMSVTRGNAHPERLRDMVMECLASSTTTTTTTNTPTYERQN